MQRNSDLALANRLADAAGEAIRPLFRGEWSQERKPDQSFVTEADRAADSETDHGRADDLSGADDIQKLRWAEPLAWLESKLHSRQSNVALQKGAEKL